MPHQYVILSAYAAGLYLLLAWGWLGRAIVRHAREYPAREGAKFYLGMAVVVALAALLSVLFAPAPAAHGLYLLARGEVDGASLYEINF